MQITRIFSFVKNSKIEVVYISPYSQVNKLIEEYYYRMLKIHNAKTEVNDSSQVHFVYLENMSKQLGKRANTDDNLLYGLRPEKLTELKRLVKNKQAYIVPSECTRTVMKLCYLLDIPCHAGTFSKSSL
jgi:phage gp16-like protein